MAASTHYFVNNNLFEKNILYTLDKLKEKTQCDINTIWENHEEISSEFNDSWNIYFYDDETIEEYFEKEGNIQLCRKNGMEEEEIWISKSNVILYGEKFECAGQFYSFCRFLNGGSDVNYWYNQMINDAIKYSEIFNSNKLIIFSGDFHQDVEDELWRGESIDKIINYDYWKIIKDNDIQIKDFDQMEDEKYNINYLYYKEWERNKNFDLIEWKEYFKKNNFKK
jgi:hypothetical protein